MLFQCEVRVMFKLKIDNAVVVVVNDDDAERRRFGVWL